MLSWCCCGDSTQQTEERFKSTTGSVNVQSGIANDDANFMHDADDAERAELRTPRPSNAAAAFTDHRKSERVGASESVADVDLSAPIMTEAERRRIKEKDKLQKLVREFAASSVDGVEASLFCEQRNEVKKYKFQMERYLRWFCLTRLDDLSDSKEFHMEKVVSVSKSQNVIQSKYQSASSDMAGMSVLIDSEDMQPPVLFVFLDPIARDRFYTCMKILRMSISITVSKQQAQKRRNSAS